MLQLNYKFFIPDLGIIMTKIDARKLSPEELFLLRNKTIELRKIGTPIKEITEQVGVSWDFVNNAIKLFKKGGIEALKPKARGRKKGSGRKLTQRQESEMLNLLYYKKPYHAGFRHPHSGPKKKLWDRATVKQLIISKCRIELSSASLSNHLYRWGLRLQQPSKKSIDRCTQEIQKWLRDHPFLQEKYPPECIYWVVRHPVGRSAIEAFAKDKKRQRFTVVTAINGRGEYFWAVYNGNFARKRQIGFLRFLIQPHDRKILIIRTTWKHFTDDRVLKYQERYSNRFEIVPPILDTEMEKIECQQQHAEEEYTFWKAQKGKSNSP